MKVNRAQVGRPEPLDVRNGGVAQFHNEDQCPAPRCIVQFHSPGGYGSEPDLRRLIRCRGALEPALTGCLTVGAGISPREVEVRWLIVLIIIAAAVAAVALWRHSRKTPVDGGQVRDLQASAVARRRLDDHRNRTDGGNTGSGGVGGWSA